MSFAISRRIAGRVLMSMRRDPRTVALMLVVPFALIGLMKWVFSDSPGHTFDHVAPALIAIFPFTIMFLVTSVTTLRERSSGTLERLFTLPMGRFDFLLGYLLAFGAIASLSAAIAVGFSIWVCGLSLGHSSWLLLAVAIIDAVLGAALGLCVSALAHTEFQAVQFMPAIVLPQLLLCGMFVARSRLPGFLEGVSNFLPLSYAVDAMTKITDGDSLTGIWRDFGIVSGFCVAAIALGALTLKRQTD